MATNLQSNAPVIAPGERQQKAIWESLWVRRKRIHIYRNVLRSGQKCLGDLAGKRVLEVGCGRGATLLEFGRRGAQIAGLDYAQSALDCCEDLRQAFGISSPVDLRCGDARALPFADNSFDFVYSVGLLEHFEDPSLLLREQRRVLRPGGFVLVQVPQLYSIYTPVKRLCMAAGKWPYGGSETQFSGSQLCRMAQGSGFDVQDCYGYGSFWLALLRHFVFPTLEYDLGDRGLPRSLKAHTAIDVCVVGSKTI